jgi:hypothetical protein
MYKEPRRLFFLFIGKSLKVKRDTVKAGNRYSECIRNQEDYFFINWRVNRSINVYVSMAMKSVILVSSMSSVDRPQWLIVV